MRGISSVSPPTLQLSKHPRRLRYFIPETKTHNSSVLFSGSFTKVTLGSGWVRTPSYAGDYSFVFFFLSILYCRKT